MKDDKEQTVKSKIKKSTSSDGLIVLKGVSKYYKMGETTVTALDKMDLTIKVGELLAVMGPSGSGKSTLLNIIGCIDSPNEGHVSIGGRDVSKLKDSELTKIRLTEIGFIFQQFYLIPTLTAFENIELPMREARLSHEDRTKRVRELLDLVGLKDREKHYPNQLSGGEQQRVAIARALANKPLLILADEPTGELDTKTAMRIIELLKELNSKQRITVIIVTHDPRVANETKRIITLQDGAVLGDSPPLGQKEGN
jgi:putative ABC transport system ATP-binding protein